MTIIDPGTDPSCQHPDPTIIREGKVNRWTCTTCGRIVEGEHPVTTRWPRNDPDADVTPR